MRIYSLTLHVVLLVAAVAIAACVAPSAWADENVEEGSEGIDSLMCPDANIFGTKMLSNVCWDCMFPIRIAGKSVGFSRNKAPSGAANTGVCFCRGCGIIGKFGVTVGYWSPSRIIENVKKPFCYPSLGGLKLGDYSPFISKLQVGNQGGHHITGGSNEMGLTHFHYYSYPILAILGLMDVFDCVDDGISDFDMLHASEVFPNWTNDSLSIFLNPEALLFGNVAAWLAQPVDCVAATTMQKPIDVLFWVSGCWGSHYPLSGFTDPRGSSPIEAASLRSSRALYMLHRLGFAKRQGGNDAVCKPKRETFMSKSFYKLQQFWPMAESGSGMRTYGLGEAPEEGSDEQPFQFGSMLPTCCHSIGASSATWGEWRRIPVTGEENIQLAWRWIDCCVGVCI